MLSRVSFCVVSISRKTYIAFRRLLEVRISKLVL